MRQNPRTRCTNEASSNIFINISVPMRCSDSVNGPVISPYRAISGFTRRNRFAAARAIPIRPASGPGTCKSSSFVPLASGWLTTAGGFSCAHTNWQPSTSASICKSNTTGIPSGRYRPIATCTPLTIFSADLKYSWASIPSRYAAWLPTNGTQGTRSTSSHRMAFFTRSRPEIFCNTIYQSFYIILLNETGNELSNR
ncbi:MAG: hypothetical protein BWY71_01895 [Planctomycetes bacterium ADurb.Bin412]|nr:MAG: hypothetical protein BWY71_01895 [Planctomycetes bacterium ADurb.Bin412]